MDSLRLERGFKAEAETGDERRSQSRGRISSKMVGVSMKAKLIKTGEKRLAFGFKVNNSEIEGEVLLKKRDNSNIANSNG